MVTVRRLIQQDEARWRELWLGYIQFYEAEVTDHVTSSTFDRLLEAQSSMIGHVAELDGHVVGFSHAIIHNITWTIEPVCYLEDLYVDPAARGVGAGKALIDTLITLSKSEGWSRIYWHTKENNAQARKLYDQFIEADDFVRYRMSIEAE